MYDTEYDTLDEADYAEDLADQYLTGTEILDLCLAGDAYLQELSVRQDLPLKAQQIIAEDGNRWARLNLVQNGTIDRRVLLDLLEDPDEEVRCEAILSGQLTAKDVERFEEGTPEEQRSYQANLNVNLSRARELVTSTSLDKRYLAAGLYGITPWMSDKLTYDVQSDVRYRLAQNPAARFSEAASAQYLHSHIPDVFWDLTGSSDKESIQALGPTWWGSVQTLKEAVKLTLREKK